MSSGADDDLVAVAGSTAPVARFARRFPWWQIALAVGLIGSLFPLAGFALGADGVRVYVAAVQMWLNAVALGYVIAIGGYALRADRQLAERLAPRLTPRAAGALRAQLRRVGRPGVWGATLLGLVYGSVQNYFSGGAVAELLAGRPLSWEFGWGCWLLPLLYAAVFQTLWLLAHNARRLARTAARDLTVDLHDLGALDAFTAAGLRYLLLIAGGLAVIPLQAALTGGLRGQDYLPILLVVVPVTLYLLLTPIYGAHSAIRCAKQAELARTRESLAALPAGSDGYLLRALYLDRLERTSEWPVSLAALGRLLVYVIIPPLAWVCAALVEWLVDRVLA